MEKEIQELENKIDKIYCKIKKLQEKNNLLRQEKNAMIDVFLESKYKDKDIPVEDLLQYSFYGYESSFMFDKRKEYFSRLRSKGIFQTCGASNETNQVFIYIHVDKHFSESTVKENADFLEKEIIPFVKPIKEGNCLYKLLYLREDTLSENGVYYLTIEDNKYHFYVTRHYVERLIKESDSLFEILMYIRANHYHDSKKYG